MIQEKPGWTLEEQGFTNINWYSLKIRGTCNCRTCTGQMKTYLNLNRLLMLVHVCCASKSLSEKKNGKKEQIFLNKQI